MSERIMVPIKVVPFAYAQVAEEIWMYYPTELNHRQPPYWAQGGRRLIREELLRCIENRGIVHNVPGSVHYVSDVICLFDEHWREMYALGCIQCAEPKAGDVWSLCSLYNFLLEDMMDCFCIPATLQKVAAGFLNREIRRVYKAIAS